MYPADLYGQTTVRVSTFSSVAATWQPLLEADRDRLAIRFENDPLAPERFLLSPRSGESLSLGGPFTVYAGGLTIAWRDFAGLVGNAWSVQGQGIGEQLIVTEILLRRPPRDVS